MAWLMGIALLHPSYTALACLRLLTTNLTGDANPPSGGRVESLRKGLSGMDTARAVMQGAILFAYFWRGRPSVMVAKSEPP